jgi:tetrapyrrole methylase family protein/MazG family protein
VKPLIHIVGLGPGDPGLVTVATQQLLAESAHVYLRTGVHPSAHLATHATTYDHHYENLDSFEQVYQRITEDVMHAARTHGTVVYAVPGSPLVLERSVRHLRDHAAQGDVEVVLHPAVSFLDSVWTALGLDPVESSITLVDGHEFETAVAESRATTQGSLLVAHTHANWVLSNIKLSIDNVDDTPVVLLHHIGLPDQQIVHTTWSEMDRTLEADHLTSMYIPALQHGVGADLVAFHQLARTLREQCPWDREQTHHSLIRYLLEETYEVVDALEALDTSNPDTDAELIEELGDLLYQIEFHATIAEQEGRFTMGDVARSVHNKLVSRHPHVFGDVSVANSAEVENNWDAIKRAEKPERVGIFDGVVKSAPSLLTAWKVQQRAAKVGFDWPDISGPLNKIGEEAREVAEAHAAGDPEATSSEIGDLLFAVVNVARHLDVDAESALRRSIGKFRNRVEAVEALATEQGREMRSMSLEELDQLWEVVKARPTH